MSAGNEQSVEEMNTPKNRETKKAKNMYQKLADAKAEIGAISKDSTNPFFKSKYFDINNLLSHVEPILHKHGLLLLQPIDAGNVNTIITDVDSREMINSEIPLPELNDPQKLGSAITYYRRYTLASLLALQAEDDDANSVKPKPTKQTSVKDSMELLKSSADLNALKVNWSAIGDYRNDAECLALKEELKLKLK